jgi:hybrid cluster-associated redox disulfide protein
MIEHSQPSPEALGEMKITDVLERWPATADVFHTYTMACVGCAVAPFFSIFDAAAVYGLPPEQFVDELLAAIRNSGELLD